MVFITARGMPSGLLSTTGHAVQTSTCIESTRKVRCFAQVKTLSPQYAQLLAHGCGIRVPALRGTEPQLLPCRTYVTDLVPHLQEPQC